MITRRGAVGLCLSLVGAVGVVGVVGCTGGCTGDSAPGRAPVPVAHTQGDVGRARLPTPANLSQPWRERGVGVPHSTSINAVVVSADGTAALSRDAIGGIRLWPRLDGSKQPFPIPARGAIKFGLVRTGNNFVVGYVDSANAAHVIRVSSTGQITELMHTPPHKPVLQLELLADAAGVVTLHKDHTFHLWTLKGTELASYEERSFRPFRFQIAADGTSLVAIIEEAQDVKANTRDLVLHRLALRVTAKPGFKKIGDERQLTVNRTVALAISPDNKRVAYLHHNKKLKKQHRAGLTIVNQVGKWTAKVVALDDSQTDPQAIKSNMTLDAAPLIAFVNNEQVMIAGGAVARSWLVQLNTGKSYGRIGPPSHFASLHVPSAFAANRRVSGIGRWLFVQNTRKGEHHYLGFTPFAPSSGAVSPNGKWVAWPSSGGNLWVESIGTGRGRVVQLKRAHATPATRVFFVDDAHLMLANTVGGLAVVEWASGKQVASADASGPVRAIEYMASRRTLRVTRANNEIWLFRLAANNTFSGPHMLDSAVRHGGLLAGRTLAAPILWTRDSKGTYKTYTWAQLTGAGPPAGPPANRLRLKPTADRAEKPPERPFFSGQGYDRFGYTYRLVTPKSRTSPSDMLVEVRDTTNKLVRSIMINTTRSSQLLPSPDASKLLIVQNTGVISVWNQKTGKRMWSFNFLRATSHVRWSGDGTHVIATSVRGATVLGGNTGKIAHKSCGSWFEKRSIAPPIRFTQNQPNICEI